MNIAAVLACAVAAAGCYRPGVDDSCTVRCTAAAPTHSSAPGGTGGSDPTGDTGGAGARGSGELPFRLEGGNADLVQTPGLGGGGGAGVILIRGTLTTQSATIFPTAT